MTITVPALESAAPRTENGNTDPTAATAPRVARSGRGTDGGAAVYSAGDDEVTPPLLLRQQLPSQFMEPAADASEDRPYLELLIDERGAVEQVRLHAKSPAPGQTLYRHRMLLAAAKAWQFEPARKHGAPVRFVMRVPLEP